MSSDQGIPCLLRMVEFVFLFDCKVSHQVVGHRCFIVLHYIHVQQYLQVEQFVWVSSKENLFYSVVRKTSP